jgi:hypothetical protein
LLKREKNNNFDKNNGAITTLKPFVNMKKFVLMFLCGTMILSGCGMSNTGKGSLIGSGAGAAIGAGLGYLIGKDGKGAAIGAAIGTAVGGGTGAIIGNRWTRRPKNWPRSRTLRSRPSKM